MKMKTYFFYFALPVLLSNQLFSLGKLKRYAKSRKH